MVQTDGQMLLFGQTRYDARCYFNVRSKAYISSLPTARNQRLKSGGKEELKSKNGYAQKYR